MVVAARNNEYNARCPSCLIERNASIKPSASPSVWKPRVWRGRGREGRKDASSGCTTVPKTVTEAACWQGWRGWPMTAVYDYLVDIAINMP